MTDIYAHMADAVMELINAKPQSPRKDELAHLLRDIVLRWDVITDKIREPHGEIDVRHLGLKVPLPIPYKEPPVRLLDLMDAVRKDMAQITNYAEDALAADLRSNPCFDQNKVEAYLAERKVADWKRVKFAAPNIEVISNQSPQPVYVAGHEIRPGDSVRFNADGTVEKVGGKKDILCLCGRDDTHFDTADCLGMTNEQYEAFHKALFELCDEREHREHAEAMRIAKAVAKD